MRIYIAVPSCRDWKPHFGASLCALVREMTEENVDFNLNVMIGASVLPRARQAAIEHALKTDYTHVLFLDDDMQFDGDLFAKLHASNVDVVAANYTNKNPLSTTPQTHGLNGELVSSVGKEGLEEVGWIGFGAVLINLSIFKDIPKPWFEMKWLEDRQSFIGEDYFFCAQVREHGVKIFINHDVKCGHVGDFIYKERTLCQT